MSRVAFKVSSSTCITRCPSTELKVFSMVYVAIYVTLVGGAKGGIWS